MSSSPIQSRSTRIKLRTKVRVTLDRVRVVVMLAVWLSLARANASETIVAASTDAGFTAYVHANGPAKDAPTAELRLIAAGGGAPIVLQRASHQLALTTDPMLADTMPAWAPGPRPWLAFASTRPYGVVRPMTGNSQIWITVRSGSPRSISHRAIHRRRRSGCRRRASRARTRRHRGRRSSRRPPRRSSHCSIRA
jgi:hypothetical protein